MLKGSCALFDAVLRYLLLLWSGFSAHGPTRRDDEMMTETSTCATAIIARIHVVLIFKMLP